MCEVYSDFVYAFYGSFKNSPVMSTRRSRVLAPGPEVIKLFSCSNQLSIKFLMLISIKISRNSAFLGPGNPRMLFSSS